MVLEAILFSYKCDIKSTISPGFTGKDTWKFKEMANCLKCSYTFWYVDLVELDNEFCMRLAELLTKAAMLLGLPPVSDSAKAPYPELGVPVNETDCQPKHYISLEYALQKTLYC